MNRNAPWLARFRALHPFPSLLVTGLTVAVVPLADSGASMLLCLSLGISMVAFQFAIGLVNDIRDARDDAVAKPWKAIPAGALSVRAAKLAAAALIASGLLATAPLGWLAWLIGAGGLACGLVYDLWLKRTPLSWLPFAIAFPLLPAWVFVAAERWDAMLWWLFPLGIVVGVAVHLANAAPDASSDQHAGSASLAVLLGGQRSRVVALCLFAISALLAAALIAPRSTVAASVLLCATVATVTIALRPPRQLGPNALFGLLALGSAALAVCFLSVA